MKKTTLPDGEIWFDTQNEKLYFSQGGKWKSVNDEEPSCSSRAYERWLEALDENAGPDRNIWPGIIFAAVVSAVGFFALNTVLHDMTVRDCNLGIQAACEELKK